MQTIFFFKYDDLPFVSSKLNEDQYKKIEKLKDDLKCLGLGYKKEKKSISKAEILSYEKSFRVYVDLLRRLHPPQFKSKGKEEPPVTLSVQEKINLQDLFDQWYRYRGRKDKSTFLFTNLNKGSNIGYYNNKIILPWKVNFKQTLLNEEQTAAKYDLEAVDEGGPTREFISQVCKQMGSLCISVPCKKYMKVPKSLPIGTKVRVYRGGTKIDIGSGYEGIISKREQKHGVYTYEVTGDTFVENSVRGEDLDVLVFNIALFETHSAGVVPVTDEKLQNEVEILFQSNTDFDIEARNAKEDILDIAKKYYRAIGRIMCHCMVSWSDDKDLSFEEKKMFHFKIASEALPSFFRNGETRITNPNIFSLS